MQKKRNYRNYTEFKELDESNILRYVFEPLASNMYMILEDNEALIIDPNVSEDALFLLDKEKTSFVTILLTHEDFDHTSGVNWYRDKFKSKLICQRLCAETIAITRNNRPLLIAKVMNDRDKTNGSNDAKHFLIDYKPYFCLADKIFENELEYTWKGHILKFTSTPGHSPGSSCILLDDRFLFTGDSLMKDIPVITRFPGGSKEDYENITKPFLREINDDVWILPGHGERFQKKLQPNL